ncbi:unnamed protein product [Malus baccata var. baccata]
MTSAFRFLVDSKINRAGETCGPLEPVHWFFYPKNHLSSQSPYGSPSELYLLPIPGPDRDMVPDEERHYLYTFDGPREFKRSSILISGYGKLYHLTDPCYNPKKDMWEPLNPFPKYGQKTGPSYVEVMGYAPYIASETWHPVYVLTVDDDMTGTKPYPSFVGRAVVVNDVMYAASTVSGVIISFSLGMDSDPSGRILFIVKNLFKFPEFTSLLEFCLLQTVFCSRGRGFQPLWITTLEIVNDGSRERCIKTLLGKGFVVVVVVVVVRDIDIQISDGFELGYCFTPQYKDLEPEEDNKCQAAMVQFYDNDIGFDGGQPDGESKRRKIISSSGQTLSLRFCLTQITPEVLEPSVGETNKLAKNIEIEDETDKLAKDFEPKEGTDKLDKKGTEVSRAGRTGASAVLLSFSSALYMGASYLPGLLPRRAMDGLVSRFANLLPRRVIGWLSA